PFGLIGAEMSFIAQPRNPGLLCDSTLLGSLLDISELLVIVLDFEGKIELFNRACEETTGFSTEQVLGQPIWSLLIPEEEKALVREIAERLNAGETDNQFTNHWLTSSGERRLIHWRNTVLRDAGGEVLQLVGTGVDITEQEQATQALTRHQQQLKTLLDSLPVIVAQVDLDYRIRFANRSYRDWFGVDPEKQVDRHVAEVLGKRAFATLQPSLEQALSGETAVYHGEVPYSRGGTRFIHGTYVPSRDARGSVDGFYVISVDLTEQNRLRERLEGEIQRNQTIVQHAIDGIVTIDAQGTIEGFNPAAQEIFGYSANDVIGQNVSMLMPADEAHHHRQYIRRYLETGETRVIDIGREVTARHRDGRAIELQLGVTEIVDQERYFVGFVRDISRRKQAEREAREHFVKLAHVTRVSALSEVTAGLAHEISQPLTAISALAEASRLMLDNPHADKEDIRTSLMQIARQSKRTREIIEQLRTFLRREQVDQLEYLHPRQLVSNVLTLLKHELESAQVTVRVELEEMEECCAVNRVQIDQVLFNLVKNATDAMGTVEGTHNLTIRCYRLDEEGFCHFSVADTGPGIDEADLDQLFHPFFTTKSHGLGQGLSICRSIVQRHGGSIQGRNGDQGGAVFEFTVPIKGR
ncbi:MAG: PAS domain S-box protein, partial [Xanthomonadaceae bacterium]|nr:PAS domain S-box protein [Xanthomonadaceae bacterium]